MRITGGTLKNRPVRVPDCKGVRPTPARVREALFHRLLPHLHGARVLDAFGGSGVLALEAWSRGASTVVCVERDKKAARQIIQTVQSLGADGIQVRVRDSRRLKDERFDIVLADPPYADPPGPWLRVLAPLVAPDGVLVFEHRAGTLPRGPHDGLRVTWQRRYGDTELTFLAPVPPTP